MLANRGIVSLLLLLLLLISVPVPCVGQETANETTPTLGSAISGEEFGLLRRLLTDTNLTSTLASASNVTLFAPSNSAFQTTAGDLGSSDADEESAYTAVASALNVLGPDAAIQVLQYHVLPQRRTLEQLEVGSPERTLNGFFLKVDNTTTPFSVEQGSAEQPRAELTRPIQVTDEWTAFEVNRIILPFILRAPSNEEPRVAAVISPTPSPGSATAVAATNNTGRTADSDGGEGVGGGSVCFPGNALVTLAAGVRKRMDEISAGDILQVDEVGSASPVYAFTHRLVDGLYDFVQLQANGGAMVTLSAAHLLYANGGLTRADGVRVGDLVRTTSGVHKVLNVGQVRSKGLYAPHTMHGDLVVGDIVVSSYTALTKRDAAHAALSPVRAVVRLGVREPLRGTLDHGWSRFSFSGLKLGRRRGHGYTHFLVNMAITRTRLTAR